MTEVAASDRADCLPDAWDAAAGDNPFLRRNILALLEQVNPCGQRYHLAIDSAGIASVAVTYRQRLNLLTFSRGALRWPVHIAGIPCSVSVPGVALRSPAGAAALLASLRATRGLTLMLNMPEAPACDGMVSGHTLPCCRLEVRWPDFAAYRTAMRSHYRHTLDRVLHHSAALTAEPLASPAGFTDDMHALYLNVFRRSAYPLECLTPAFFRAFPATITVFRAQGRCAGFVQTLRHADTLYFMFGGVDDTMLARSDTYRCMLLHMIRTGIDSGCRWIDLGQTAEAIKLKFGCTLAPRRMQATHAAPAARWLLRRAAGLLSYRPPEEKYRVFRD